MSLDDLIIQRSMLILDCFTSTQEIQDDDFSLINIACTVLYMSAKYDNRVPGLDFYTFFAYIQRLDTYTHLLSFWNLQCSDVEWPEMIYNRIEAMVFESLPRYQINVISPVEVCYEIAAFMHYTAPEAQLSSNLLRDMVFNTYLCMASKY